MKKMFFALAALLLAFTACTSENEVMDTPKKKEVKVTVNMDKPGFGEDTRAERTGWEEGDEVVVYFGDPLFCLILKYNESRWTTETWVNKEVNGESFTKGDSDILNEFIANFLDEDEDEVSMDIYSIYFSSGVKEINFGPITRASYSALNIKTHASAEGWGECIMTSRDGRSTIKRTDDGFELTLNVTMEPRVAQFTIRNLSLEKISVSEYGGFRLIANLGPVNMYSGGSIRTDGVYILNNWSDLEGGSQGAVAYQNADGVSFYAVPWLSNDDIPTEMRSWYEENKGIDLSANADFYKTIDYNIGFSLPNGTSLSRNFGPRTVNVGDAVIMNGPYTEGAEDWKSNPFE